MEIKAKTASLISKTIGAIIIIIGAVLIWLGKFSGQISDVIMVGFAVACLYGTVDINLFLEKIFKK